MDGFKFAKVGRANITDEQALKYSYQNDIKTLGRFLFDRDGIETALKHLVAINKKPEIFMNSEYRAHRTCVPSFKSPLMSFAEGIESLHQVEDDVVEVYFNGIHFEVRGEAKKEKWWENLRTLEGKLTGRMPCGVKPQWWYGPSGHEHGSEKFNPKGELNPYQGFLHIFGERGLHIFSCFVNGNNLEIDGSYSNYGKIKPGEAFEHENMGCWKGTVREFLDSAEALVYALGEVTWQNRYLPNGEVKLVHPELGAISMRSFPSQVTLADYLDNCQINLKVPKTLVMSKLAIEMLAKEDTHDYHSTICNQKTEEESA
jgi:hypothetical protein